MQVELTRHEIVLIRIALLRRCSELRLLQKRAAVGGETYDENIRILHKLFEVLKADDEAKKA